MWNLIKLWSWENENKGKGIGNRFQDKTWTRKGKSSDFRKIMLRYPSSFDAPSADKDSVVAKQIDWLKKNVEFLPPFGFSEMLCQEYPRINIHYSMTP